MEITIKEVPGRAYRIRCVPSDTVEDIKRATRLRSGIPILDLRVFLEFELLNEDHRSLSDHSVEDESTLVVFRGNREASP